MMDTPQRMDVSTIITSWQLVQEFTRRLELAGVYAPFQDAQALLAHAMGVEHVYFQSPAPFLDVPLDGKIVQIAEEYLRRREKREPLARILGFSTFWGLKFRMFDKVFRPDPHAEALVDNALIVLEERKEESLRLLDLGTGSGCLLLALLHSLPKSTGVGVDIDDSSVSAATQNALDLGLQDRAVFVKSNWGENIMESFDFIISNPPCVMEKTIPLLDPEMREHEKFLSLAGGADGLDSYRSIAKDLDRLLKPDGIALLRVSTWDREARLFKNRGFVHVEVKGNYRQNPWCMIIRGKRKKPFFESLKKLFLL